MHRHSLSSDEPHIPLATFFRRGMLNVFFAATGMTKLNQMLQEGGGEREGGRELGGREAVLYLQEFSL
jgi:hypothetical protein